MHSKVLITTTVAYVSSRTTRACWGCEVSSDHPSAIKIGCEDSQARTAWCCLTATACDMTGICLIAYDRGSNSQSTFAFTSLFPGGLLPVCSSWGWIYAFTGSIDAHQGHISQQVDALSSRIGHECACR